MQSGTYRYPDMDRVIYGRRFDEVLPQEVTRLGAKRVLVLASRTLERETDMVSRLRAALGQDLAAVRTGIGAHTPRTDVVSAANAARDLGADLIVTLGGGSITDAAKMVGLCCANDITDPAELDRLRASIAPDGSVRRPSARAVELRTIAIPTTLSAGEYTAFAGCTDTVRHVKESFAASRMVPSIVILDPASTITTPSWLFLSTGIRAVDHAVEDVCSVNSQPLSDGTSLHALRLLVRGLTGVHADAANLEARLDCQLGAWLSMIGSQTGVNKGASHGIGHVLGGTAGVPHGYTSCVMLPAVLRFNKPVNAERQAWISEALGQPGVDAADAVAALIARLGLPGRLRDMGVKQEQLDAIAEGSMHDRWVHTNPRPIEGPATVRALLDAAW
jgi:maleylacetate reductase